MTIEAMTPVVREALGVSSSYDSITVPAGIRRAIAFLLRSWTFPRALAMENIPIAPGAVSGKAIVLPALGVGKIHAVRLTDGAGLFKRLRRTLIGELPHPDGPAYYWQEGNTLFLDTAITEGNYSADVWYNNTSVDDAEAWITVDFEDIVFTLSVMRLAQDLRKPEVQQAFAATWAEQVPTLAQYLNEVEFNDLDVRMMPELQPQVPADRYGT